MEGVSIVIPVYNEKDSIINTITQIHSAFKNYNINYEIIAVDDGSIDGTRTILESNLNLNYKLIVHPMNKGYGAAIKSGVKVAQYNNICITDSDGTYPNHLIPQFYKEMDKNDMVVGARIGKNVHIPLIRRFPKWVINKFANYVTKVKIPDLNSGFRIFKKDLFEQYKKIFPDGFSLTSTITIASLTNGYLVKYIEIDYLKRKGKSKIHPIKDTINFFLLITRTCLYFNPLRIFVPFSMILFMFAIAALIYSLFFSNKIYDATIVLFAISSIQILGIGLLADTIVKSK